MLSVHRDRDLLKELGLTDEYLDRLAKWPEYTPEMAAQHKKIWDDIVQESLDGGARQWLTTQLLCKLVNLFHYVEPSIWNRFLFLLRVKEDGIVHNLHAAEAHIRGCSRCANQLELFAKELITQPICTQQG